MIMRLIRAIVKYVYIRMGGGPRFIDAGTGKDITDQVKQLAGARK